MCHVDEIECSRNVSFVCHIGSIESKLCLLGENWVTTRSKLGQMWVTWVTHVMVEGLWVMCAIWVM